MKLSIRLLSSALALTGLAANLHADVVLSNLGEVGEFRGYGPGLSAGTLFTTGPGRVTVNTVTLEHLLYDPANPPQHFQVRLYQAVYQPGNPDPSLNLVAELGNPVAQSTPTQMPGLTTYVTYSPLSPVTLQANATYAITVGEPLDGANDATVLFTASPNYAALPGWSFGGDLFGVDLGSAQAWSTSSDRLKFQLEVSPALNQPPDISQATASVPLLWPPDGQMVQVHIDGVTDADGDPVSIAITGVQQDEPPFFKNKGLDATLDAPGLFSVRAARCANGNGRVYKVSFTASDGKPDGSVDGVVYLTVPHDQAHPVAIDDGPVTGYFNSLAP